MVRFLWSESSNDVMDWLSAANAVAIWAKDERRGAVVVDVDMMKCQKPNKQKSKQATANHNSDAWFLSRWKRRQGKSATTISAVTCVQLRGKWKASRGTRFVARDNANVLGAVLIPYSRSRTVVHVFVKQCLFWSRTDRHRPIFLITKKNLQWLRRKTIRISKTGTIITLSYVPFWNETTAASIFTLRSHHSIEYTQSYRYGKKSIDLIHWYYPRPTACTPWCWCLLVNE